MYTTILFDMDNTLLHSKINFAEMRHSLIDFLVEHGLVKREELQQVSTPAQVLAYTKSLANITPFIEQELWEIVSTYEQKGMEQVKLEEGVLAGLEQLRQLNYGLAVVTNNAYDTACFALEKTKINSYFGLIVGREQMQELKPSPSGIVFALEQLASVPDEAVMVGDSWIDGKAAQLANVDYIAYKAEQTHLVQHNVQPVCTAAHFDDVVEWIISKKS